jgi:CRP-like cAMP-binding protein
MPLRRAATAELLSGVPLFSRCSKRDLAAVAKLGQEVVLPVGHTMIHEKAPLACSFFVLIEGGAEVRRQNRVVATLAPGDFFGELALILNRPRTATVTLTAPSRLLSISAHHFHPLLIRSPEIQFKLLEALAERLAASAPA